jgi:purine nucleosidase
MEIEPMRPRRSSILLLSALLFSALTGPAQTHPKANPAAKVIIDTDVGDDIDDAFALDLALASPELNILGISAAWGDTSLRARMLDRMMCETGHTGIPIQAGPVTKSKATFSQEPWASEGIEHPHDDAVSFLLEQINRYPGEITLLAIGPLTNIGAAIDRDPTTFRKLKRVVMMGGSIYRGYSDSESATSNGPDAEYNIASDPASAQKLFRSGVPIFLMPLDSTQLKFDEAKRASLASVSTPMTDTLLVLIAEWSRTTHHATPTLFDPVAAAYAIDPASCPTTPLHIEVDEKGYTRVTPGTANVQACLEPQQDAFFKLLLPRLLNQKFAGDQVCTALSKKE